MFCRPAFFFPALALTLAVPSLIGARPLGAAEPVLALVQPGAQEFHVLFEIDLRAEIAAGRFQATSDRVGVRSGTVPLGWSETRLAADPDGDGIYKVEVAFPRAPFGGQPVTYKFKIERPERPGDGWEDGTNRLLYLRAATQTVRRAFNSPPEPPELSRVGTIRRHPAFPSRLLPTRDVQVYLPPGYDRETKRRYPVLYFHDGQNVFDGGEQGMEWQVDEAAEKLISTGRIEPVIVVAVANTKDRFDEYAPTPIDWKNDDGSMKKVGGKAGLYGRFLAEELKPFIDRTYRSRRAPEDTALGGASLGGLVSLWLGLEKPKVFGAALAVSPAVRWDGELMLKTIEGLKEKPRLRLWVDVGTGEGDDYVAAVLRVRDALIQKGWKEGVDLHFEELEGGQHDEISWASRVEGMLRFLYGTAKP